MQTADQVAAKVEEYKRERLPIKEAAWNTACDCVGWPYVFGAWGEYCTPQNRKKRAREDHPTIISACQVLSGKKSGCDGCKWYPDGCRVRMFDCRGFTDWVLKQYGIDLKGEGATSQWNSEENWTAKGTIDSIPDDQLVCLFVKRDGRMQHTGFGYQGASCECSSGVQYYAKRTGKWTHWALPKGVEDEYDPDKKPTLKKGDSGTYVTLAQELLMQRGYELPKYGADGQFGNETLKAVKAFQQDHGLTADGVIGADTWTALEGTEPTKYYTVTVPHLTLKQAEGIIAQYPEATRAEE